MTKKILIMAAVAALLGSTAMAQTRIGETQNSYFYNSAYLLPGEFAAGGATLLLVENYDDEEEVDSCKFLDKNLSTIAEFYEENLVELGYHDFDNLTWSIFIPFTQTLFNNDADWEYIRWVAGDSVWHDDYDYWEYNIVNLDVVKTDGTVLFSITPTEGRKMYKDAVTVKWGGEYFIVVDEYVETDYDHDPLEYQVFYRINRPTQSITRVEGDLPISVVPSVADRNQTITVERGDGTRATEVQVVNAVGQVVKTVAVQPGQREVKLRASDLGHGAHIVGARSRNSKGACKIIVR